METLAFTYYTASYEDPCDREGKSLQFPNSQQMGLLTGTFVLLSLLSGGSFPSYAIAYQVGSRGETVAKIQQTLGIPVDGIYGRQTERAVRNYQQRQGLQGVDGIAGKETLAALGLNETESTGGQILQAIVRTPDRRGVNLRSTPNGTKIGGLAEGDSVSLTGEERQIGGYRWVKLARGGWVAKTFLQPAIASPKTLQNASSSQFSRQGRVTTPSKIGANLRRTPDGERVNSLPEGALVMLTGEERSQGGYIWLQTRQGTWIAKDFLQIVETETALRLPLGVRGDLSAHELSQNFQGDRGKFVVLQTTQKYDRPDGNAIGAIQKGEKLQVTKARSLANGIAWAKLADGSWVDVRAIDFRDRV